MSLLKADQYLLQFCMHISMDSEIVNTFFNFTHFVIGVFIPQLDMF